MDSQAPLSQVSQESARIPSTQPSSPATPAVPSASRSASPVAKMEKFTSPAPPTTSSMTPPPSSQLPSTRSVVRTPTPPTPGLSSPPPTSKLPNQPSALTESAAALYTPEQVDNASTDELRVMVNDLTGKLRDVRLSAAHHKLQYNMAVMESQETASRMAVELAMAQREIDVLQKAEEKRRNEAKPEQTYQELPNVAANAIFMSEMKRQNQLLQNENEELRDLYEQQKRLTEHREGELAGLMEENDRLKSRIRKNRDHIAPYLPYLEQMNESPRSAFGTPHATSRHKLNRVSALSDENSRGQSNFEALLLADKMLSQETATAPSTPARSHGARSRFGHTRGAQSMSSLPQTPRGRAVHVPIEIPRTPTTFSAINIPQSAPAAHYQQGGRVVKAAHARRESSNSTITASSVDEEEAFTDREEEVTESQASQLATSMLRRVPSVPKRSSAPSSQSSNLVQSKIFGQVKKGHGLTRSAELDKKRQLSQHHASPTKRGRIDGGGVGLGIGLGLRD
ncbi:hypothetical protein PMIN06_008846 [Paraphaeosphaeria minitans]|uniref:Uncharacterized protein n=1 Tax=Paraphaeosphaeria minitans TaxID=565426 RepID=A0A9P6GRA5_9PLEO|nr:hypothetical protein PMIN01_02586 [Paraphaeosphaeria minitans]